MQRIGIIGAGAWGTALATAARRAGRDVTIWAFEPEVVASVNQEHVNPLFLPGVTLDPAIRATDDPAEAADADAVLVVAPAQHLRTVCGRFAPVWKAGVPAILCAKGIEQGTGALMTEAVADVLPNAVPAVLSGPTFAIEVARELPTAVTLACADAALGERMAVALRTPRFRIYGSTDIVGAQIGGAVKNVLAIACGIVEGKGLGDNARAALITRGMAEIARLGQAKGASAETLTGLCGLGDLTLTCNARQSRNYSVGIALGEGQSLQAIIGARRSVAEGVFSAASVVALAERIGVEMPISAAVDAVVNHGADIDSIVEGLLARPFKLEDPLGRAEH